MKVPYDGAIRVHYGFVTPDAVVRQTRSNAAYRHGVARGERA